MPHMVSYGIGIGEGIGCEAGALVYCVVKDDAVLGG